MELLLISAIAIAAFILWAAFGFDFGGSNSPQPVVVVVQGPASSGWAKTIGIVMAGCLIVGGIILYGLFS